MTRSKGTRHVRRRTALRQTAAVLACAAMVAATPAGTAVAVSRPDTDRGDLVSATRVHTWKVKDVRRYLTDAGFDDGTARHGVDAYRLVYETVDARGRPTTASGLLVLPRDGARRLRTVSFAHGTSSYRPIAPSTFADDFASSPGLVYGSVGFASVSPDYLGLGVGSGPHPWMDVPSETTASLDMLRAAAAFAPTTGRTLDGRVLVTGFSQGASAAMGLARELRRGADRRFGLAAVTPVSGAYDLRHAELPAMLKGELDPKMTVAYTTYLLVAWNRLHHLYASPDEVFQAPYADKVDALFDGGTPGKDMLAALPDSIADLLTPRGFALLRHPRGRFAAALRTSDGTCAGWLPHVPVRLYEAGGDEQAANANTRACADALHRHGVAAPVVELGTPEYQGSRHLGSGVAGVAATARWFASLD